MDIKTFDNKIWTQEEILPLMLDDSFYYGYLGKNALSSSSFKTILKSWEDYQLEIAGIGPEIPKQALRDGRLIHLAVLEPHRIADLTIIDSTKGSNLFKQAVADRNEAEVYTTRELKKCMNLASNVPLDFDAWCLLHQAEFELPVIGMIEGLAVRGKADIIKEDGKHIIDLKTTSDASRFEESIDHWSYDLQGALYLRLFDAERFSFIILDKRTGEVSTRELTPEEIKRGDDKLMKAINVYKTNTNG